MSLGAEGQELGRGEARRGRDEEVRGAIGNRGFQLAHQASEK
jgi:hypothetical protein